MRKLFVCVFALFALLFDTFAGRAAAAADHTGPALQERHGVHRPQRPADAPVSLTFHPEDMNDVLKSFSAWNPESGRTLFGGLHRGHAFQPHARAVSFRYRRDAMRAWADFSPR